jgi:uncharacterized protein
MSDVLMIDRAATDSSPDAMPKLDMVVVQPTPFCNIACRYCYLPSRNTRGVISQETVQRAFAEIFASGFAQPELKVVWHAGEPLVVPVEFYRTAFATIEAMRPAHIQVRHSFQTNGMLLTREWCDLIRDWQMIVGVSIDGPRDLHDANRVTRAGRGTFDQTLAGIHLLQAEGIPFNALAVLSAQSLAAAQDIYDFFAGEGIEDVCFNVEESEGQHASGLFAQTGTPARFRAFLEEFWRLCRAGRKIRFVREIDGMIPRIFRPAGDRLSNPQVEPLAILTISHTGKVSTFSPELLGYDNAEYDDFIIGDINHDSLQSMLATCRASRLYREIAAGVEQCRCSCDYFSICGGGAPANKLSEAGSFDAARTTYCTLTQMTPTDVILAGLDRLNAA